MLRPQTPAPQPCFTRPEVRALGRKRRASAPLPGEHQGPGAPGVNGNRPGSVPPLQAARQGQYVHVRNTPPDRTLSALPTVTEQQATNGAAAADGQQAPATEAASTSASGQPSTATTIPPPPAIRHQDVPPINTWDNVSAEHDRAIKTAAEIITYVQTRLRFGSANQAWNFARSEGLRDEVTKRVLFLYQRASFYLQDELRRYIARWEPAQRAAWIDARLATYAKQLEDRKEPLADSLKREFQRALTAALGPAANEASAAQASNEAVKSAMDDLRSEVMNSKPRLRALASLTIEAGNCDQMAAITFMLARERFPRDYLVQLIGVPGHVFCRVGKRHWRDDQFIVIDPWPRKAYPILAGHHLGYRHFMTLRRSKPALGAPISNDKQARYARFRESMRLAFADYETTMWAHQKPSDWYWTDDYLHHCLYPTPADQSTIVTYYVDPAATEEESRAQAVYETMQSMLQAVDAQQTPEAYDPLHAAQGPPTPADWGTLQALLLGSNWEQAQAADRALQASLSEMEGRQPPPDAALQALLQAMEGPPPRAGTETQPRANSQPQGERQRAWFDGLEQLALFGSLPHGFDNA